MKLYVCWGTFPSPRPGGHPCGNAYHALKDAGHEIEASHVGMAVAPRAYRAIAAALAGFREADLRPGTRRRRRRSAQPALKQAA